MNSPSQDPLAGEIPSVLENYGVDTTTGRLLRQGDAKLMLKRMAEAEETIAEQERINREVTDRIELSVAEKRLELQYLIEFGVRASERQAFQVLLSEVAEHGGLTLREAAGLAHARMTAINQSSNGIDELSLDPDSPSLSAAVA
ncbi:hypothetical protein [Stratiformator vulcanicus]|uniref:Uncharacterized protein n=1 Tax=Stratiformator vulcanicus TaxID=2527980 RepID=A0A517R3D2_9PLAN|nr:hypothetical protein [Stratiformator vulcanicus]QDT38398.1 hypothetical protein Pan189_27910 [Stratiformator vulcanicus]